MTPELEQALKNAMARSYCAPSPLVCRSPRRWCEGRAYGPAPDFSRGFIRIAGGRTVNLCKFFELPPQACGLEAP